MKRLLLIISLLVAITIMPVGCLILNDLSITSQFRPRVDSSMERKELKFEENISVVADELENKSQVYIDGTVLIGADGHYIIIKNNPYTKNHTWLELKEFLFKDDTDSVIYDLDKFVCTDFAEKLHNNAEVAGFRAAFVSILLGPCSYYPIGCRHSLNAFETSDRGLVYIDCTGTVVVGINADKIVNVKVGEDYIPQSIFPDLSWSEFWDSLGEVWKIETVQW